MKAYKWVEEIREVSGKEAKGQEEAEKQQLGIIAGQWILLHAVKSRQVISLS